MADEVKPLAAPLSGKASLIVGTISGLVLAAAAFVPAPWNYPVGILGFIGCALAGVAVKPPDAVAGKPVLQGTALVVATSIMTLASQFYALIPVGWPQSVALGVLGLLAWLTGGAMPTPLKGTPALPAAATVDGVVIDTKAKALEVMQNGTKGPPAP